MFTSVSTVLKEVSGFQQQKLEGIQKGKTKQHSQGSKQSSKPDRYATSLGTSDKEFNNHD